MTIVKTETITTKYGTFTVKTGKIGGAYRRTMSKIIWKYL